MGAYENANREKLRVTAIQFGNGTYSFRVPDAQLVLSRLRFVDGILRGVKQRTGAEKGRSVPEVVQMVRKL